MYKPRVVARTGEDCMIVFYSQLASSRPKPMLDARIAL
jgi:hypothetical protein